MNMPDKAEIIAQALKTAHDKGENFENLKGDLAPADEDEAYAAQWCFHRLHGQEGRGPLGGRKIALASQVQQELCGIDHPIAGGIFAREIQTSPAKIERKNYHGLGIEFELAFQLADDIHANTGPYDKQSIRPYIAGAYAALELIIDRGADYENIDAFTMIADNAWSAGIVVGNEIPNWRDRDLDSLPVTLRWNDDPAISASTGLSNPLASMAWMISLLTGRGQTVKAGEFVITGSVIRTRYPVAAGQVAFDIAGLSTVSLRID